MVSPVFPGLEDSLPEWQTSANDTVDLREYARREAARLGVPESHGLGTLLHESGLDPNAYGNGGGVGQFLEDTARSYGTTQEELRANPKKAVTLSLQLLKDNADMFGGDYDKAAAAYFIGAGNIRQAERLGGDNWRAYADQLAAQYRQGTVSDYLSSALGQHLSTGTTAPAPASSGYTMMSTTRRGTPGVTEEQRPDPIAQLDAARERRRRDAANLAAPGVDPVTGEEAILADAERNRSGTYTPAGQEDVGLRTQGTLRGRLLGTAQAGEQGYVETAPHTEDTSDPLALLSRVEEATRIAEIPGAQTVRDVTGRVIRAGLPQVAPVLGLADAATGGAVSDLINPVPTNLRDLTLMTLPFVKPVARAGAEVAGGSRFGQAVEEALTAPREGGRFGPRVQPYRGAPEGGAIVDEAGNVVQGGQGTSGPVGRYRRPSFEGQPVGGGAPTPAEEAAGGARQLPPIDQMVTRAETRPVSGNAPASVGNGTEGELEAAAKQNRLAEVNPPKVKDFPVGTYRLEAVNEDTGKAPVSELRQYSLSDPVLNFPEKSFYKDAAVVDKYREWIRQGSEPPPMTGTEILNPDGSLKRIEVIDGHYRAQAIAAERGPDAPIKVWVERTDPQDYTRPLEVQAQPPGDLEAARRDEENRAYIKRLRAENAAPQTPTETASPPVPATTVPPGTPAQPTTTTAPVPVTTTANPRKPKPGENPAFDAVYRSRIERADAFARETPPVTEEMRASGEGFIVEADKLGVPSPETLRAQGARVRRDATARLTAKMGTSDAQLAVRNAVDGKPAADAFEAMSSLYERRRAPTVYDRAFIREVQRLQEQLLAPDTGAVSEMTWDFDKLTPEAGGAGVPGGPGSRGGATPPPGAPTSPVNFDDVRGEILRAAQEERNLRATGSIERQNREGRARQAGAVRATAREGGTLEQVGYAAQGAMYQGGTFRKTFLKPIILSPEEIQVTVDHLGQMVANQELTPWEYYRFVAPATSERPGILNVLQSDAPRLQPAEVRLIRKAFGDEVAKAVAERSDLSLEPRMTDLQERRLIEAINREEARIVAKADADAVRAQVQANLKQARAQETKDNRDIAAANRERERAIRAEAAAAQDEMRGNMRALDAMTQRLVNNERLALEEENAANMRALNAMTRAQTRAAVAELRANQKAMKALFDRSYEGIYAKAAEAAKLAGGPNAGEIINYQLQGNREILDRLHSPEGLDRIALTVRSAITGDLGDSYLTALQRRTESLRGALVYDGMDPEIAGKVATTFRDAELALRYPQGLLAETKAMLAEMKGPAYGDSWGALDKFIQRWKNTVYSTDFGVVGTQLKAAVDRGSVSGIAGYVNRTLSFLNLPHAELYSTEVNLPRKIRDILDGVYVGSAPSATDPRQGTLFSYATDRMGAAGDKFDTAVEWLMEKSNQIQFRGILGHARDVSYEGNLAILRLLGRDIRNPRVRKTAADFANATTLFAQTALNKTRAGWEKRLLTSAPMLRSEVANVLQMAKVLEPGSSAEERILGATAILSRLVAVLLVGKLINDHLGKADYVMNPFGKGFGTIVTGIKDKAGRNVSISMFPQESLVKAFGKAVVALADSDPKKAQETLLQGISGRLSLPGQLIENVAGYGYDTAGHFHTGDLHLGLGGVLLKTFAPPIGQQLLDDASSAYLFAQSIGVSAFPESTGSLRDRKAGEMFPGMKYGDLTPLQRDAVDKTPDVVASRAETPSDYTKRKAEVTAEIDQAERTALDAFKAGTNKQKITDIWHDLGQRRLQAAKDLASQFKDTFAGFDKTKYNKALTGYYDINETFKDGTPDFDSTDAKRQEFLAKLPTDQQAWVKEAQQVTESKKSPERQQYDRYIDAKKKLGYFDIDPKDPQANAKRAALDAANPEIDVASWYYSGTSEQAGAAVSSPAAADKALSLNLPNRPVKISGYSRPVNETPKVREVYSGVKGFITDYEDALRNQANLDSVAVDVYDTKFATLNDDQKQNVRTRISTALQREHPQLDAVLAFFGRSESLASDEAKRFLDQMIAHAGIDPTKDKVLSKVKLPIGR